MAGDFVIKVYSFVYILFVVVGLSYSYLELNLENDKVCSISRKRDLDLKDKENSAISLKELRFFDTWSGAHTFNCNFSVHAPWGYGIIAVIQNLNLRENESTKECIDHIQFQKKKHPTALYNILAPERVKSKKFCGIVNSNYSPDELENVEEDDFAFRHNTFIDEKGNLDVNIYVAGQRLALHEKLDIAIIFTAYKLCTKVRDPDGFKVCKEGSNMCIWEGFFKDKIVNCPFKDCFDEGGCPVVSPGGTKQSSGLGTKVTIGAVVLILGLLLLFMLCLFVCRRCQVLCWSGQPAARPQRSSQQSGRVEMSTPSSNVGVSSGQNQPTAPPLLPVTSAVAPVHEDKDLPPPYESLFPSR